MCLIIVAQFEYNSFPCVYVSVCVWSLDLQY